MSSAQAGTTNNDTKRPPVEVTDWNELVRYVSKYFFFALNIKFYV